ncbi:ABC transporter substrate-binding protein [Pseudooceanicola lipolyticus]|uniref:ABC transporter substrate-binding protein n=1 Tax=Pseudooceanicola lipolyticus TaxID=2029104 RepID=A0A2M8J242_9RHOB|nr:ABC transporter substrate-binding protein [Pseudooceanicola lipolyticus]
MRPDFFSRLRVIATGFALVFAAPAVLAESQHGIAMYGAPALPPDFVSLPYANPEAPKGGRIVFGNTGGFDSLNPFVIKGTSPWQLSFLGYESLMGRSMDEPFSLYGVLAESIATAPDRSWVEFTLRPEARFSDGSPVTVEDVIWSYETLGTQGHLRYRGFWSQVESIAQTGPRSLRISFASDDRELALIAGMRPVLKKAQWQGKDIADAPLSEIPIGTGPYVVSSYEAGRRVVLSRNPDYWGADIPFRRGTMNFDEIRLEFFGDETALFEAFKAGEVTALREYNAEKWATQYDFPAITRGEVVKSELRHGRPTGMTGLVMNTRRPQFADWRVREAMLLAFNFEFINDTVTGGAQPRIGSYFDNSDLAMRPGPAEGAVRALLAPFADTLFPGALEGYALPESDGTARNRGNLRAAADLLAQAGWTVQDGQLTDAAGTPFAITVLLRQGDTGNETVMDIYARALARLGIAVRIDRVDNAQYAAREAQQDFDMTAFRRDLSLSPGNEQRLYWGSAGAEAEGTRNLMGARQPAIDAMIDAMLAADSPEAFTAAVRALDRALMTGRYVIPLWQYDVDRIAHASDLQFPDHTPVYGDRPGFLPEVWWQVPD